MNNTWKDFLEILTDPAHWMFEIFLMILFDGLILGLLYPLIKKRIVSAAHREVDAAHHHGVDDESSNF